MAAALVSLRDLSVVYRARGAKTTALLGLSLDIRPGEWLAIAGESGSGKSTLAHLVAGTLPREATIPSGEIRHTLRPSAPPAGRRWPGRTAGDVLCVDQDVRHLLDARAPVGVQLEDILCHQNRIGRPQAIRQALDMLEAAGIEPEFYSAAPAALSGGMRRRIALLCAVARKPRLLVLDDPFTGLDAHTCHAMRGHLLAARPAPKALVLCLAHPEDAAGLCDRLAMLYSGTLVEARPPDAVLQHPKHPYLRLRRQIDEAIVRGDTPLPMIPGDLPDMASPPDGCIFHPRCPYASAMCKRTKPPQIAAGGHACRCHLHA